MDTTIARAKTRMRKWMDEHEEWVRLGAAAGVVLGAVGLGVGLSRTFRMDAKEQVEAFREKNEALNEELAGVWRWIDAQMLAGAEFKPVDDRFRIDGQDYSDY
jgi:hypothetical protein